MAELKNEPCITANDLPGSATALTQNKVFVDRIFK
jgi:hypothetical protein